MRIKQTNREILYNLYHELKQALKDGWIPVVSLITCILFVIIIQSFKQEPIKKQIAISPQEEKKWDVFKAHIDSISKENVRRFKDSVNGSKASSF